MRVAKGHAYGNDFLLALAGESGTVPRGSELARSLCHRHHGIGADGIIFYTLTDTGATMTLFNADGSASELSGNGVRCLAALVARTRNVAQGGVVAVDTGAGPKTLEVLQRHGSRYTFRTVMGAPEDLREVKIPVLGETVTAS